MASRKILYPLKRYRRGLKHGIEAGNVLVDDGPGEKIYCQGTWYHDGIPRTYHYKSGRASNDDGWMLD